MDPLIVVALVDPPAILGWLLILPWLIDIPKWQRLARTFNRISRRADLAIAQGGLSGEGVVRRFNSVLYCAAVAACRILSTVAADAAATGSSAGPRLLAVLKRSLAVAISQVMDPLRAMFQTLDDDRTMWINGTSLESGREFELVGP